MKRIALTLTLILPFGSLALAADDASARRGEKIRVDASELRQKAETIRQEGNPGRAQELERQADALDEKADGVDDPAWPPAN